MEKNGSYRFYTQCYFSSYDRFLIVLHDLQPYVRVLLRMVTLGYYVANTLYYFLILGRSRRQFLVVDVLANGYRYRAIIPCQILGSSCNDLCHALSDFLSKYA